MSCEFRPFSLSWVCDQEEKRWRWEEERYQFTPASLEAIMEVVQKKEPGAHDSVAGTGTPGLHTRPHRSFRQACRGLTVHVRGCASEGGSSF